MSGQIIQKLKTTFIWLTLSFGSFFLLEMLSLAVNSSNSSSTAIVLQRSSPNGKKTNRLRLLFSIISFLVGIYFYFESKSKRKAFLLLKQSPRVQIANILQLPWLITKGIISGTTDAVVNTIRAPISQRNCIGYLVVIEETIFHQYFMPEKTVNSAGKVETNWKVETIETTSIVYKDLRLRKFDLVEGTGRARIKIQPNDDLPLETVYNSFFSPDDIIPILNQLNLNYTPSPSAKNYHVTEKILAVNTPLSICGNISVNKDTGKVKMESTNSEKLLFLNQNPTLELNTRKRSWIMWSMLCAGSWFSAIVLLLYEVYSYFQRPKQLLQSS